MKNSTKTKSDSTTEIELVFDGQTVKGVWYHPRLMPIICKLCGKECSAEQRMYCTNTNPWCG